MTESEAYTPPQSSPETFETVPRIHELEKEQAVLILPDQEPLPDAEAVLGQGVLAVVNFYPPGQASADSQGVLELVRADNPADENFQALLKAAQAQNEPTSEFFLRYKDTSPDSHAWYSFVPPNQEIMNIITGPSNMAWFDEEYQSYPRPTRVVKSIHKLYLLKNDFRINLYSMGNSPVSVLSRGMLYRPRLTRR